ncbi:hypothetical protein [Acinetobacter oleivorans]|uniref:hypothetical protein n=1 Tax=Acinetobacter oleivorans TaxID=1148157 RepID=UPI0017852E09|nr:hypothetical protein [Acinetobacter oleivorans]
MSLRKLVEEAIVECNVYFENKIVLNLNEDTILYGENGQLDSMSLVTLIAEIEDRVEDTYQKNIILASEKAMSQRNSPFRSINALVDYIELNLNK